jgi:hypothetical protein
MPRTLLAVLLMFALFPSLVLAAPIAGEVEITTPLGRYMALKMDINDTTTTFELTGPDFSWFAFGFDTTMMNGYSLIIEGLDGTRTAHERNLIAAGNPGAPQATQNISIVSTVHDAANDLTTITLERLNNTGDPNDPNFSTSMTSLDVIWAYRAAASPAAPVPNLNFHGQSGRGATLITFSAVPEPCGVILLATMAAVGLTSRRTR